MSCMTSLAILDSSNIERLLICLRKLSGTSWKRWLDGQVEAFSARPSSLNFACGVGDPQKILNR